MHVRRSSGFVSLLACAAACSTPAPSRTPVAPAAADWMAARMPDRAALPPANRHVDDMKDGARIVFEPGDEAGMFELRERVRVEAQRIAAGTCPIAMPNEPVGPASETRIVTR